MNYQLRQRIKKIQDNISIKQPRLFFIDRSEKNDNWECKQIKAEGSTPEEIEKIIDEKYKNLASEITILIDDVPLEDD